MFSDPSLHIVLIVLAFSAVAAFVGYWTARGQLESQLRELKRENDAYAEWIDTLVDLERTAAKQRHPANIGNPVAIGQAIVAEIRKFEVINGGAS